MTYGADFLEGVLRLACTEVSVLNCRAASITSKVKVRLAAGFYGRTLFHQTSVRRAIALGLIRVSSMEASSNGPGAPNRMRHGSRVNQSSTT